MKNRLTTLAICLSLLVPGIGDAKPKNKPPRPNEAGCELLLVPDPGIVATDPNYVSTGKDFTVKLVRVPSYPGAFRHPTIDFVVYYLSEGKNTGPFENTITIPLFNVTYAKATFTVPSDSQLIGGQALIDAMVTEPTKSKNKVITTTCSTTAAVQQGL